MAVIFSGKSVIQRFLLISRRYQHGYIILVPEIGEDHPEKNPLYQNDSLPEFNNITIENCRAAIAKQTIDFEEGVNNLDQKISKNGYDDIFKDVFEPLEKLGMPLDMTWGLSKTLYLGNSTLMPTSSYMAIHDRARTARASKYCYKGIYEAVKSAIEIKSDRTSEENRMLQKFIIEGKLNGLELDSKSRIILTAHLNRITREKNHFREKADISTRLFTHTITDNAVTRDFPEDLLKATAVDPNQPLVGPWKVTLQPNIYMPVMEYCSDRELRWNLWQALVGRGANFGNRELTTSLNMEEIRYTRRQIATMLGYESYVEMSMETKMAGTISNVQNMLSILLQRAKPAQDEELSNLHSFAIERGFRSDILEPWDIPYWRRKQINSLYGYNEANYKPYFPLQVVLDGLFKLCEKLFNILIQQRSNVSTWHKDVKYYDIFEPDTSAPVAGFYFDPYARSDQKIKFENAGWMVAIQNRSSITNRKPLAALIFNFDTPVNNEHSHLTFKEVKSLFHKFGHALQHLLTRTTYSEVAGLSYVEWDAVEVSGHVLSHWLLNKNVLDSVSSSRLPKEMFDTLVNIHRHMAGMDLCKELYLSALDLELHSTKDFWLDIIKRMWPQYRSFTLHKKDWHPCSFTQIFVEEWGAAYYSHIWSRMIAADIFSAFQEVQDDEEQILDIGKRYRETFLALGGSGHSGQIFREFRGRDPCPKALLKSLGIKEIKETEN